MPDKSSINKLLSDFLPATKAAWIERAKKELNGDDSIEALTWVSPEGLHVKPYYDKTDLNAQALKNFQLSPGQNEFKGARSWDHLVPVPVQDETAANKKALQHLTAGADGILFDLRLKSVDNFDKLLNNIALEFCIVSFLTEDPLDLKNYYQFLENKSIDTKKIKGAFYWKQEPKDLHTLKNIPTLAGISVWVPASPPIEEISNALIIGNQHIQKLLQHEWKVEDAFRAISFSIAMDTDFFISIAKLKALRYLWFQIANAYELKNYKPEELYLHARSEAWINPDFQPHGNLLKETSASMAAILGGADGLTVFPEDTENEVMSRIALNTSHILREESHLNKVADPLAGSYLVENIMMEMASKAWAKFQSHC